MNSRLRGFLICAAIPALILISMTVVPLLTLAMGQEIRIKTLPVDPRDVFRGDYVVLNYAINELPMDRVPEVFRDEEQWQKQRQVPLYVVLKAAGEYYEADYATFQRPASGIYLKGHFEWVTWGPVNVEFKGSEATGIRVTYNLDQYFVPENTGRSLEELSRQGELDAVIKVWNGYAMLERIEP